MATSIVFGDLFFVFTALTLRKRNGELQFYTNICEPLCYTFAFNRFDTGLLSLRGIKYFISRCVGGSKAPTG